MAPRTYATAVRPKVDRGRPAASAAPAKPRETATAVPAALDATLLASRPDDVLQLQRDAGNRAVTGLVSLQRAPAPAATKPKPKAKAKAPEIDGLVDLLGGFQSMAVAVVHHNGRGLAVMKFGNALNPQQRKLLSDVQRVLFLVQRGDKAQVKRGRGRWPALAEQLRAAVDRAKTLGGISSANLKMIADTIEVIGTDVVGRGAKGDDAAQANSSYVDFANGVGSLLNIINEHNYDYSSGVMPKNYKEMCAQQRAKLSKVEAGGGLNPVHRKLFERLRGALIFARTPGSASRGLAEWKAIAGDVFGTLDGAAAEAFGGLDKIPAFMADIGSKLFSSTVYLEAHIAALAKVDVKNPADPLHAEKVKTISQDLLVAKDLADKAIALTGAMTLDAAMKSAGISSELGGAIWDLAKSPGEILSKMEEYNKRGTFGKIVTIADMGDKMLTLRNAIYNVSLSAVKDFAERQGKAAVQAGVTEAIKRWESVGKWADDKLAVLGKVGKVAGVISLGVSAIKMIDAIAKGDWGAAIQEAGSTALGLGATAAGGAAGAAMFAGIGVILAAEAQAISGAAAMIRYCREVNVREAALDFIGKCEDAANLEAKALIANLKVLSDPSYTGDRNFVQQQLQKDSEWWHRHLLELEEQMGTKKPNTMGGRPELRKALGSEALKVLDSMPATTWEGAAEQIRTVFAGANKMAAFVVKTYPRTKAG